MKNSLIPAFLFFFSGIYSQITIIPTGVTEPILKISKLSNNNIIICGRDGYFSRSIDECDNLIPMNAPGPANYPQYLSRPNINASFILASSLPAYTTKIYKSTNDCNNWSLVLDSNNLFLTHMEFFDANEGFAVGVNKAIRFKNGGSTRIQATNVANLTSCMVVYGDSILAIGWSDGGNGFVVSRDRGYTWIGGIGFNSSQSSPADIFFLNKDTVFCVSTKGFFGPFFGKSFNGGAIWQKNVIPNYNPGGLYFKSATEGYLTGMDQATAKGIIAKTTDMGQTWSVFYTGITSQLLDIVFLNDSIALVSGTNGTLFKWNCKQSVFVGIDDQFMDSHFINFGPNPVKEKLKVNVSEDQFQDLKLSVGNVLGQTVYPESHLMSSQEIDMSSFPNGVYFLKIQSGSSLKTFKILKQQE